jgi:polar amino acid transport system substrate-binding protein
MFRLARAGAVAGVVTLALAITGCADKSSSSASGGSASGSASSTSTTPTNELEAVLAKGVLSVATDPAYPPQSSYDQATGQWTGFDIDVATDVAKRLGVTVDWQTPNWDVITAGKWNGRWDLSVGSMTVTNERAKVLNFSTPYYYTPAGLAVQANSSISSIDQLSGKTVGSCGACTYEYYLERKLSIPNYTVNFTVPADVTVKTYDTDSTAIQDLATGRLDAVMSAVPTLQEAIKKGTKIKLLGDPVYFEPLAIAADKSAQLPSQPLIDKVNEILAQMRQDGTLTALSMKYYGQDLPKGQGA